MEDEQIPQLSDEELGLRSVSIPDNLDPEAKALIDGLMEDRRKLKGSLEKSTHTAKTTGKALREERFARLQAKHPALKAEMLEGIAPEKWEEHVGMWSGAFGGTPATPPATTVIQEPSTTQPIDPTTGQPIPERHNTVSPAVAEAMVAFMNTINQGGQVIADGPMTFEEAEAKLASDPSWAAEYRRRIEKGLVTGMPKMQNRGGKLIVGG